MAINLTAKYASAIEKLYTHSSFLRPHCKANVEMTGAKSCRVYMLKTNPVVDYNRSGTSRYGELKDVQDIVNEYIMTQDKAFNGVVDKGDESEQAISNKSALWLRQEIAEQCVPTGDKYGFSQLAKLGHINGVTAEPAKSTIVSMVYDAAAHMDENLVPESGRVLFIRAKDRQKIIMSDEWSGLDSLAGKQLPTGTCGQIAGFTVVTVPSNMFPADVYMIAMHTSAVAFPYRINDTKIHNDPVGAMRVKFREIRVDPLHQRRVVFAGHGLAVQIPQSQLLCQNFIEYRVLILLNGIVDAAVGKGAGGDQISPVLLHQLGHPLRETLGKDSAFHLIVFFDAVVAAGGVENPVSYVYQIQQIPKFLVCQFELHKEPPPISL